VDVLSCRILLRTSDLDRSRRFYRDLLGLVRDPPQLRHSSVLMSSGFHSPGLVLVRRARARGSASTGRRWCPAPGTAAGLADDMLWAMNTGQFWRLMEDARARVPRPSDGDAVAALAAVRLSAFPREEIVSAQRVLSGLMAASYRNRLWAAAYLINGGYSDDGFEYFRGWLIAQGREVFERSVADPDSLADLPVCGRRERDWLECEDVLYIPLRAHRAATGEVLPEEAYSVSYPELDTGWDFDDRTEMGRRLPRLTARWWPDVTGGGNGEAP